MSDAGKGDLYRPVGLKYYKNYERIFGVQRLNIWERNENGDLKDEKVKADSGNQRWQDV